MYSILHHENLIVPKKILLRIDDKDITFKGQHSYQGLLLLENSSLIKCSYLAEDEQHNLYAIKVYNFENDTSRQNFIKQLNTLKTVAQPFFPAIKELISEKDVPQVLVIEKFEGCLSLKVLLEEFQNNEDLSNKLFEGLIIHKLLIKLFDCLFKFEQIGEYHGFLNLSNLCIKPTTPLQQDYNMKTYLEAILEDFSIAIWDVEAHKYWEIVSLEPSIRKNSSLWKSILTKNGMVEAPEFDIHGQEISRLSIKYDVWMVGIVLLQIICFGDQRKSDLLQEFSKNLPQMNFQERSMILKEFIQDPLLYKLALLMFQDLNHRPLPSEIVQLDLFMQMKKLLDLEAKGNEASSLDIHLSYEVLLIGLSCNNPNIALNALTILLNQALDGKEVLLQIINDNTYSQIIAKLKSCQDDSKLIEMGIKFFIQVLGQGGRRVANIFKASGIMSLVLRCIENDFDPQLLCQLFQHFGSNSTETFIHFVEKSGFVNKIIHYLKSENNESNNAVQKQFYLKTSHFYKLATLLEQSQFLSERELFLQLLKIPVVRRPDLISLKVIKKLLTHYGAAYIDQPQVNELALESFYQTLFSWMFLKNIVIYTSCHSQCIAALLLNDMSVPYESGFHCKTCSQVSNTNVFLCIKCASHCHVGHVISGLGYQYFTCSCESVTTCKRRKPEPIPNYLLNQNENYLDTLKISFNKIPKNFKAEIGKNIFLNTNGEIGTIITSIPLCSISSNINHNRFGTEKIIGYYEVEIKLGGFYDQNAVGFTTDYLYPKDEFAGYIENSIAYHGDDGAVYLNGNVIAQLCGFGSYDVIGCGITNFGTVYLTHNGVFLAEIQTELLGPIFPIVSLRGRYSSAQVNFEGNFMFNYEELKDNISEGDYIKFLPPSMIESLYFHPEWLEIFKKLDKMKPCDWLTSMLKTMTEKKEQSVQPNKEGEKKENENIQLNTIGEKDIDVIKELQSIDTMLREGKKSVKEFTSTRDYEIMRSLVQESNTISGNDRNISLNNENNYYNNSKSITGLGLRDTNMNEHLSLPMKSEKYLAAIPEKPVKEKKSRKNGLCHCNSENNKTKKGCEMF